MQAKPAQFKQAQPKQPQPSDKEPDYVKINTEKSIQETKQSLKQQESFEKLDNKKQEAAKPHDPIVVKSNHSKQAQPTRNDNKPAIASFGQIATGSRAAFFTIHINQVLASKHSLEMQIGSLSMLKLSDIVKKNELMRQIFLLQQQIEVLKAQQEQAATAELIQQQVARYKNTTTPKPKWV